MARGSKNEGKHLVGVDIGSTSVKVVQIDEDKSQKPKLTRFGIEPLPAQTIVDGHVISSGAIVTALEKLFANTKRRDIALRLSGHGVIIKKITMPILSPEEFEEQISWEAEQHIPFDLSEVQVDSEILLKRPSTGQMEVLLVAAKKEEIRDLVNLAMEARLRPKVIDLDAFAIQNVYEAARGKIDPHEHTALLHVGASLTTLNVIADGTTAFTRDVTSGGQLATEILQRRLGLGQEECDVVKVEGAGSVVRSEIREALAEAADELAGEMQRTLDFYLATSGDRPLSQILLSGGSAGLLGLREAIEERAGVAVKLLNLTDILQLDEDAGDLDIFARRASELTVATGLALRRERERFE